VLTGAPAALTTFSSIGYSTSTVWNAISAALTSGYLVGCDTTGSSEYNLPTAHAYSVFGAYQLKDTSGNVVHTLYHVRNPWGQDYYDGPWSDTSSSWTTAFKAQVPYADNANDGSFFIEDTDLVRAFYYYQIGYVHPTWNHSYYSKTGDTGSASSYTFTLPSA
jgi:hypothetical protein